jgi:hypothetical protein
VTKPLSFPSLRGANGSRECAPDDRLRDEAIHLSACGAMDCFASLAMTVSGQCPPCPTIEETRDLMLRPGFEQRGRFHLAALHHIAAAGVEGAA